MIVFPTVNASETKSELIQQIKDVNDFLFQFYKDSPNQLFLSNAVPDGWSIKRNLKHCTSSNITFGWWIGLPPFFIKILGKPKTDNVTMERIRATNRFGITDYGKYLTGEEVTSEEKTKLLDEFIKSKDYFIKKIESKSEMELKSLKAPFGGLNLFNFSLFTLKHNLHHSNVVNIRLHSI
jgi:hypothetical protein